MGDELFALGLAAATAALLAWGCVALPRDGWQILASAPLRRRADGAWDGVNFTYYGFFSATAYASAAALDIILMSAAGAPLSVTLMAAAAMIAVCAPAARIVARMVEKKQATFTVGGAVFTGVLLGPLVAVAAEWRAGAPALATVAAMAVAYALGEGLGRLACVSFGCCYGKPVRDLGPLARALFSRVNFIFTGETKKAAYEGNCEGVPLAPVQAITSALHLAAAAGGAYLFLNGHHAAAFIATIAVTQGWRAVSEFLRADWRGGGRLSAYQIMALAAIAYSAAWAAALPSPAGLEAGIMRGLAALWNPWVILPLEALGAMIFIYMGRSEVTGVTLSFHVARGKV